MSPFFSYYGGKWRAFKYYPAPAFPTIIEPFAGAAGYATRYFTRNVKLVEKDPIIAGLWRYLINVKASEIRALPILQGDQTVDDFEIPQEAKWLIGLWIVQGRETPHKKLGSWAKQRPVTFWSHRRREKIASQVDHIRHWKILPPIRPDCLVEITRRPLWVLCAPLASRPITAAVDCHEKAEG